MTALRVLTELEYSRYSPAKWGKKASLLITLFLFALLLAGGIYLFDNNPSQQASFTAGSILLLGVMLSLSAVDMLLMPGRSSREWFLTFPQPRITLLYAKALSLLRHGLYLAGLILAANAALYSIFVLRGYYEPLPAGELALLLAAHALFAVCILPVAICCGLLTGTMLQGWRVLLLIPYSLLFFVAPLILLSYVNSASPDGGVWRYMSPSFVLLYALAILFVGWPIGHMLMRWIAKASLGKMGEVHYFSVQPEKSASRKQERIESPRHSSGFLALYRLDLSRLQQFEKLRAVQIIKGVVPAAVAVFFYLASGDGQAMLPITKMLFALPVLFASIWIMNRSSFEHKQWPWWLCFPHSRLRLMISGIAAAWVTALWINAVLGAAALAGIGAGLATGRVALSYISSNLPWLLYAFLTYTLVLTLSLCLLQISYYLMKSKVLVFLIFPLYIIVALQQNIISQTLFPDDLLNGNAPNWRLLGWIALIGLPLAAACLPAGAKYLHLSLGQGNEKAKIKKL